MLLALCSPSLACGDVPDLVDTPWRSLEIEYCSPTGETRVWKSDQPAQLEPLRRAMAPAAPQGLTMILTSYTNEMRLELVSGQRWNLYYRTRPTDVTFHDPDSIKRSFAVRVSEGFHAQLSSALIASGGGPILLGGECRLPRWRDGQK